ncbi:uncharacterized protein ColSpa_02722 [Colletotrichum spaethianum]|uniref:Uncharacterized protein n=1 Tax=Colletotrichum spaethianum TaxID=700344 RepID=A0AA37L690_9PEZI|nr:uncharacterized protein ColSpa_02722 [Colletotrichum spaethianum]GKT42541.1 hypothetical protein ColSpa_02722 [Colletotrichum spaethianum]
MESIGLPNGSSSPSQQQQASLLPRKRGLPSRLDKAFQLRPLLPQHLTPLAPAPALRALAKTEQLMQGYSRALDSRREGHLSNPEHGIGGRMNNSSVRLSQHPDQEPLRKFFSSAISRTISRDDTACEGVRQQKLLADWGRQNQRRHAEPQAFVLPGSALTRSEAHNETAISGRAHNPTVVQENSDDGNRFLFSDTTTVFREKGGAEREYRLSVPDDEASMSRSRVPRGRSRPIYFDQGYDRPPPGLTRAQTFSPHVPTDVDLRSRSRERLQPRIEITGDSESEDERRHHRSSRHKTDSPEPIATEYRSTRYKVIDGRTYHIPPEAAHASAYRDESPPSSRADSKTAAYYERPPMSSKEASYSSSTYFPKVKTARYNDVQYSDIPHRYREEYAGYA